MSLAGLTALGVAFLRAAHQVLDATPLILDDPIALRLLDADTRAWVSEPVFTFAAVATAAEGFGPREGVARQRLAERAAEVGEPWQTFDDPSALVRHLIALGFAAAWMPTPAELAAGYFLDRPGDLPLPRRRTLVAATV